MKSVKILFLASALLMFSCSGSDEDEPGLPTLSTTAVSGISTTTAISGGNVSSQGNSEIISRGVCWSTSSNPTINNTKTVDGTGTGNFTSNLTGLTPNTNYYIRAYATNSEGTSYGNQVNFQTTNGPIAGTSVEYIYDIVTDRQGNTTVTNGVTTCLFVDGVFFDMDPNAVSYSVLFYDMARSLQGTPTTYPADVEYEFNADAGIEIRNGPYGNQTLTNWYNVYNGLPVTRITPENKLFVHVNWCTHGGCVVSGCYLITGKAKVTVHY
ncbi:hypothetical protein GV828_01190 [Flavobacterium sp. NST-5]|uniref:Fibronectin type-III domain-containing protein n=1 Tax=Flavobacterium ichthyis TaxID=2698827 RepID=A0ABW9ZAH6_9FLAO|nr:fibronectin type III domain-containing protein [Flavobacterium ichthyis]NBL63808.1 hypothetical protein [Flavobacterium ichthyis]